VNGYYPVVVRLLRKSGFELVKYGKGDHEHWSNGNVKVIVPYNLTDKITANSILKQAGLTDRV
jgi:predicted RNA binding protein YcfA (HicA-like mRNA interferase family)